MAAPQYYKVLSARSTFAEKDPTNPAVLHGKVTISSPFAYGPSVPWDVPSASSPGDFAPPVAGELVMCGNGYHVATAEKLGVWFHPNKSRNNASLLFAVNTSAKEPVEHGWRGRDADKVVFRSIALAKHITPLTSEYRRLVERDTVAEFMEARLSQRVQQVRENYAASSPSVKAEVVMNAFAGGNQGSQWTVDPTLYRRALKSYQGWLRGLRHRDIVLTAQPNATIW